MKSSTYAAACGFSLFFSISTAQAESVCSVALTAQAFDTVNATTTQNIAFASRDDLCNKTYSSLNEAQSSARSAGFNVSYAGVGIGASGAQQNSEGRFKIDQTDFCQATAEAFQAAYTSTYSSQIATAALAAWSDCIKATNQNQLFMTYQVDPTGNFVSGILKTTVNTGELNKQIKGITVSGPEASNVRCSILNVRMEANKALQTPLRLEATDTGVACSKAGAGGAAISIATSAGSLPFIELPSTDEVARNQKKLEAQQAALQVANADLYKKLADLNHQMDQRLINAEDQNKIRYDQLITKINAQFSFLNNLGETSHKFATLVDLDRFGHSQGAKGDAQPRVKCDDARSFIYGVSKYEEDNTAKMTFYCRSWPVLEIK